MFHRNALLLISFGIAACLPRAHAEAVPSVDSGALSANQAAGDEDLLGELRSVYALVQTDQQKAESELDRLLADPRFASQSAAIRHDAHAVAVWLALEREDYGKALLHSRLSVAADDDVVDDWYTLAALEFDAGHRQASAQAVIRLARQWPESSDRISSGIVSQLLHQSDLEPQLRTDLLQALTGAEWRAGRMQASDLWYELTLAQSLAGQQALARQSARRVSTPDNLIKLRSDKQFDAAIDRDAPQFDVGLAASNQVQSLQLLASRSPDSLELRNELNDAMLTAGMTQEALVHADLLLSKLSQLDEDDPLFSDKDERNWTMNNRAVALRRLGRIDEAAAQLEAASRLEENGSVNVSQMLNLSQFLCSAGRPAQARQALDKVGDDLAPYGRMVKASSEQRIALQTGDAAGAAAALKYLQEHRQDSQAIYFWALLEARRLDDAAEALKELLASPKDRSEALSWVQQTLRAPPLQADAVPSADRDAVFARPDVQAAIARVGYVERYPVFIGYMGD